MGYHGISWDMMGYGYGTSACSSILFEQLFFNGFHLETRHVLVGISMPISAGQMTRANPFAEV